MIGGYMGKLLFVNLSTGEITEETPEESLYRDYIGGYGIGARIIYSRQKGGVDPLGPENTLGFIAGPLTGTPASSGARWTVVCKSPLTGGWGDSNAGMHFGVNLKYAGYDGVFMTGIADKPVYLLIDNGKVELRDASHLWGKNTIETDDMLKAELGKDAESACIGPAGEKLSLISLIVTRKGSCAGRSGVGAVMGSKKLKAVVVRGDHEIPIADVEAARMLRKQHITDMKEAKMGGKFPLLEFWHKYGSSAGTFPMAHDGHTGVKNWGGVGAVDFPDRAPLYRDNIIANIHKPEACWHCPMGCKGIYKAGTGEYKYPAGANRPEMESMGAFGANCLNNNLDSIIMCNNICQEYGLDTISAGGTMAFAIECYEKGLITKADTDGIELTWGNHQAIVAMTEKMARREGLGEILADGSKKAAERIGKGSEDFAIHSGGQELGHHDPKFWWKLGVDQTTRFIMDATPGKHMQFFGDNEAWYFHVLNMSGLCAFGTPRTVDNHKYVQAFMTAVTGLDRPMDPELFFIGQRVATLRHCFNLREGINPLRDWHVPDRALGIPPQTEGPNAGITIDYKPNLYWYLGQLDWDPRTAKPSRKKLLALGLDDVVKDLYPPPAPKAAPVITAEKSKKTPEGDC